MVEVVDYDDDFYFFGFVMKGLVYVEVFGDGGYVFVQGFQCGVVFGYEVDVYEEVVGFGIVELVGIGDVVVLCCQIVGDCGYDFLG